MREEKKAEQERLKALRGRGAIGHGRQGRRGRGGRSTVSERVEVPSESEEELSPASQDTDASYNGILPGSEKTPHLFGTEPNYYYSSEASTSGSDGDSADDVSEEVSDEGESEETLQ